MEDKEDNLLTFCKDKLFLKKVVTFSILFSITLQKAQNGAVK